MQILMLFLDIFCNNEYFINLNRGRLGHDRKVAGHTTTYAISAYHHWSCEVESFSQRGVLDTTLCDKVCQYIAAIQMFSPATPVSSTNKTDIHESYLWTNIEG